MTDSKAGIRVISCRRHFICRARHACFKDQMKPHSESSRLCKASNSPLFFGRRDCSSFYGTTGTGDRLLCCAGFGLTPGQDSRPCVASVNSTAAVTPIFTCAGDNIRGFGTRGQRQLEHRQSTSGLAEGTSNKSFPFAVDGAISGRLRVSVNSPSAIRP